MIWVKFECRSLPTLSTIAEVVMDNSIHKMAVMPSNRVTSFLNINLAWVVMFRVNIYDTYVGTFTITVWLFGACNIPCARRIKLSSIRTVVLAKAKHIFLLNGKNNDRCKEKKNCRRHCELQIFFGANNSSSITVSASFIRTGLKFPLT